MEHTDDSHRQVEKILHNSNIPQNWMLIQNWQKEIGQRMPKCWHRFKKLQEFLASTGSFVDVTTIFRALHTIYLGYGVVWQDLPYLTKKNSNPAYILQKIHLESPKCIYGKKQFKSDETELGPLGHNYKRVCVAQSQNSQLQNNTIPSVKNIGGNISLWGCFSLAYTGDWVKVKGIRKSSKYQPLLA